MKALLFSGGKDSCACLFLYEYELDNIYVIWVNTGMNYPEALEVINMARQMCPHFIEVKSDRVQQNLEYGLPSDIGEIPPYVQGFMNCCYANIMKPAWDKIIELGISEVIIGQRNEEHYKSTARDGDKYQGVTRIHPIEGWTGNMVLSYLSTKMVIPQHFMLNHSSLDCYDCTAYLDETQDRIHWAAVKHPDLHAVNVARLERLLSFHNGSVGD